MPTIILYARPGSFGSRARKNFFWNFLPHASIVDRLDARIIVWWTRVQARCAQERIAARRSFLNAIRIYDSEKLITIRAPFGAENRLAHASIADIRADRIRVWWTCVHAADANFT